MHYVIARPWDVEKPESGLNIYTLHSRQVQTGTPEDAKATLDYVKRQVRADRGQDAKHFAIYEVTFTKKEKK